MLICMTGIDGCGKTTQLKLARQILESRGFSVAGSKAYTDEIKPTFTPWLNTWDDTAVTFLFQALHAQQCSLALQDLSEGKVVLADRWDDSYIVYHRLHGPLSSDDELRDGMNRLAFRGIKPDLTILFTIDPLVACQRRLKRGQSDIFDQRKIDFFSQMQEEYKRLAEAQGYIVVPAEDEILTVHSKVLACLDSLLHII